MKIFRSLFNGLVILSAVIALTGCGKPAPETSKTKMPAFQLLETLPPANDSGIAASKLATPSDPSNPAVSTEPDQSGAVCGGPDDLVLLALGVDENAQTDVLRLVRADFVQQRITVLSIPRDLWVPISGLSQHSITEGRINSIYGYGEVYTGRGSGVEMLTNNIHSNFGVEIDHYGLVDLTDFAKLIDKIGGVDIELEKPVSGDTEGKIFFPAGLNHLNGQQALAFSRIRELDTDDYRIDRQTLVVKAALKKMRDDSSVTELVGLGSQFMLEGSVKTDLPVKMIYSLACLSKAISGDNITFLSMPPDLYTPTVTSLGGNIRLPNPGAYEYVGGVMSGAIPPESE